MYISDAHWDFTGKTLSGTTAAIIRNISAWDKNNNKIVRSNKKKVQSDACFDNKRQQFSGKAVSRTATTTTSKHHMGQDRQEKGDSPTRASTGAALFRLNYFLKSVVLLLKIRPKPSECSSGCLCCVFIFFPGIVRHVSPSYLQSKSAFWVRYRPPQ